MRFADRSVAGAALAGRLAHLRSTAPVVVALTRGGVPVGAVVAEALDAPLVALSPRKIGHPAQPEYAIAAVCEDGPVVAGREALEGFDTGWLAEAERAARREARRRREAYGGPELAASVDGRVAVVVDDGLATGLTMRAAVGAVRAAGAARIVVAVPVAPSDTLARLSAEVDEVEAVSVPDPFPGAIGFAYERFDQVDDDTVRRLLVEAQRRERASARSATSSS
jgi:putative phosphoribosyl transferase